MGLDLKMRVATLNLIIMGHNNFLEPTRILIMRISVGHIIFQPTTKFLVEIYRGPQ